MRLDARREIEVAISDTPRIGQALEARERGSVSATLQSSASAIRHGAESLYLKGGISERVADVAQSAADKIDASAAYLESHDPRQIVKDLAAVVKRHPLQSLLLASAVGFLCWCAFRNSRGAATRTA